MKKTLLSFGRHFSLDRSIDKSLRFSQNVVRKIARKHRLKDGSLKAQRNGGDKFPIPGHK